MTLSILQNLTPEDIPSQKYRLKEGPILNDYRAADIWTSCTIGPFMSFAASENWWRSPCLLHTSRSCNSIHINIKEWGPMSAVANSAHQHGQSSQGTVHSGIRSRVYWNMGKPLHEEIALYVCILNFCSRLCNCWESGHFIRQWSQGYSPDVSTRCRRTLSIILHLVQILIF